LVARHNLANFVPGTTGRSEKLGPEAESNNSGSYRWKETALLNAKSDKPAYITIWPRI